LQQTLGQSISKVSISNATETKCDQVVIPTIKVDSAVKILGPAIKTNCSILDEFIGNSDVKRLSDLFGSHHSSTSIVIGWYDSVYEGVDIWSSASHDFNEPRLL
jgi:hypothetical protein